MYNILPSLQNVNATYIATTSFSHYVAEITGADVNININVVLESKVLFTSGEGISLDKTGAIWEGFVLWQKDSIDVGLTFFEIENLQITLGTALQKIWVLGKNQI